MEWNCPGISISLFRNYRLHDCRYCSYKNMIYEMHTAANFPFVMAVFLHKCAWTIFTSSLPKKKNSFLFRLLKNTTVQVFHRHANFNDYFSVLNVVSRIACFLLLAGISIFYLLSIIQKLQILIFKETNQHLCPS